MVSQGVGVVQSNFKVTAQASVVALSALTMVDCNDNT